MNRRSMVALAGGGSALLATIVVALLCVASWNGTIAAAFCFLIWSEIVLFGGVILTEYVAAFMHQPLFRAAWGTVLFLYSAAAFVVSLVFMILNKQGIKGFLAIQEVLFVCMAVALAVTYAAGRSAGESSGREMDASGQIEWMIDRLNKAKALSADRRTAAEMGRLAENLRFTDLSVSVPVDEEIERVISLLEEELAGDGQRQANEQMERLCRELDTYINQRKIDAAALKRGKI